MFDEKKTKEMYDYCVENNWNVSRIREFASLVKLDYEKVLYTALEFAKKNNSDTEYKKICEMVTKNKKRRYDLDVPNPVLSKNGEIVYQIWRNEEEKELVLEYIYNSWKTKDAKEIGKEFGFDTEKVLRLVREYAFGVLKMSQSEWQEIRDKVKQGKSRSKKRDSLENVTGNAKYLSQLLKAETLEEIVSILDNVYDLINLKGNIHDYLIIYHDVDDYNKYRDILMSKIAFYSAYEREKKKEQEEKAHSKYVAETLPSAVQLIATFVESECNSVHEFIDVYKIVGNEILNGDKIFNECLKLVRHYNIPLYERYQAKVEKRRQQNYQVFTDLILTIVNHLKEGIDDDGHKRPFDIIDYFKLTSMPLSSLLRISQDMARKQIFSAQDHSLFFKFYKSNMNSFLENYGDINVIYSEQREINCVKNSKGYPIPGTGEIISDTLKEKMLDYLKDNHIPINYNNYSALLNRYKNGFLEISDSKKY